MNKYPEGNRNWNEFQWERELRREERRISCYFRELAGCLDLPGEENMIYDQLSSHPGLVPAGADPAHWRMWDALAADREEEESFSDQPHHRKSGEDLVEQLDKLSAEWNLIFAGNLKETLQLDGLAVSCAFGKLLVRITDFVDAEADDLKGLKLSLGKRALREIADLCSRLQWIAEHQPSLYAEVLLLNELLQQMRERLIDLINALRRD